MSTQHQREDQTALAVRLQQFWQNFRQGKVVGYKVMAVLLILIAMIGCVWYIVVEGHKNKSALWVLFEEANSVSALEEISQKNPNTLPDRLSRLQIARYQLGVAGIDQLGAFIPEQRQKAVDNIEKAREALQKLLPEFETDPVFKAECLLGLAKAEAALVGVPVNKDNLNEFKGSVPKVVEYLDQLAAAAAKDSPWATNAKKLADSLRNQNSPSEHEFVRVERELFQSPFGNLGGPEPQLPGGHPPLGGFPSIAPPEIPGVPLPPRPPKQAPPGPTIESAPASKPPGKPMPPTTTTPGTAPPSTGPAPITPPPKTPAVPPAKTPEAKTPNSSIPAPIAPGPKPPEAKTPAPTNPPKAPEPNDPTPPTSPKQ